MPRPTSVASWPTPKRSTRPTDVRGAGALMAVDPLVETFGPFLIPVVVFVLGVAGYGMLWLLSRWGVLPADQR
jgi:hypothetical protein